LPRWAKVLNLVNSGRISANPAYLPHEITGAKKRVDRINFILSTIYAKIWSGGYKWLKESLI
jgi:hypothetical protein